MLTKSESIAGPAGPENFRRRCAIILLVAVALVALGLLGWAARVVGLGELMARCIAELRGAGAPVFFSAMAILPALGFPLLPFALAAGPVFVPVLGTGGVVACAILAVSANVALSYGLARTVLRSPVEWVVARLGYRLPDSSRANAWVFVALVRVAPGLPFCVQSYGLGLMRVRFGAYLIVSTLVPASYLTGVIVFGDAMLHGKTGAAFFAIGLVAMAGTGIYFLRKKLAAKAVIALPSNRSPV